MRRFKLSFTKIQFFCVKQSLLAFHHTRCCKTHLKVGYPGLQPQFVRDVFDGVIRIHGGPF